MLYRKLVFVLLFLLGTLFFPKASQANRLMTSGFELATTTAGVEIAEVGGVAPIVTLSTNTVRTGSYSFRINTSSTGGFFANRLATVPQAGPYYVRFYMYIESYPSSTVVGAGHSLPYEELSLAGFVVNSMTAGSRITIDNKGIIRIRGFSDALYSESVPLPRRRWHRIEYGRFFDADPTTDDWMELRINGRSYGKIIVSDDDVADTISIGIPSDAEIGGDDQWAGDVYFDDWGVNIGAGTNQTSFLGEGRVATLHPNAQGTLNMWLHDDGTTGDANNYTEVDETTPDDFASYVKETTTTQVTDNYDFESVLGKIDFGSIVNVVSLNTRFRATSTGAARTVQYSIQSASGSTATFSGIAVWSTTAWASYNNTTAKTHSFVSYKDPETNKLWKVNGTNSLENLRMNVTGVGNAIELDMTAIWATIEYVGRRIFPGMRR